MARNPRLDEAVAIFTELGWADATYADAPTLPIGTDAQRQAALAGLRSGEWGAITQLDERAWGWRAHTDVDLTMLWLFSVRVGVDARRAATISSWAQDVSFMERIQQNRVAHQDSAFIVLAERGPTFARAFVERLGLWMSDLAVPLVAHHQIPVPQGRQYLEGWAMLTTRFSGAGAFPGEIVRDRFAEHVRAGVAIGLEGTGDFGRVIPDGVVRGWLDRDEAVELVLAALDAAGRPADRKVWLTVWLDDLHATDEEILARAEALTPVLGLGDGFTIERLAPVLIAGVDDDLLADVSTVALAAPTKKALRVVLKALAERSRPSETTVEVLGPQVTGLDVVRDRASARAVQGVVDAWGLAQEVPGQPAARVDGLWRPVPPVWTVPRFDHGEETPEALTQAAAELSGRRDSRVVDVAVERFLALANAVARRDPELARSALVGVRDTWDPGLAPVASWVEGQVDPGGRGDPAAGLDKHCEPLRAREFSVFHRLGEVPCLLSEPSTVDLRIAPVDLLSRLRAYQDAGADVAEADLLLALTRLDASMADDGLRAELEQVHVPVVLWSGKPMRTAGQKKHIGKMSQRLTAGAVVSQYLADPAVERLEGEAWRRLAPESLRDFPPRLEYASRAVDLAVFPTWGHAVMHLDDYRFNRELGLEMRRLALHATPLPPTVVLDFLSARSDPHPVAVDDAARAVTEAWERGLLRPGTPGARYVDLAAAPSGLAADVRSLGEAAREGLLAVVWQILDDLAGAAASGQRLATGAADVVEAVATFLPEVVHAVAEGVADPAVLNLPGVRALAERSGTSKAVTIAREVVAGLPTRPAVARTTAGPSSAPTTPATRQAAGPSFAEIWPDDAGTLPAVVDDAALAAVWVDPDLPTKMLRFDLTLPDHPGMRFEVVKGWTYDLEAEGQCRAERCPADAPPRKPRGSGYGQSLRGGDDVYLFWDGTVERLTVCEYRDRARPRAPLSTSLVAVCVGLVAQDGDFGLTGEHLVTHLAKKGRIGWAGVRAAATTLLASPDVSPARLVRALEKHPARLPVLWPLLTEPVRVAGASEGPPPRWLNRVLDVALLYADHLREAARRGLIPADAASWPGLEALAARPGKTAAVTKARSLLAALRDD